MRVGLALVTAIYLGYCSFGIAHPVLWGHYGHHTGEYTLRARNTLRFHMLTPATSAGYEDPTPQFFYFHHPVGYHYLLSLAIVILGDHDWTSGTMAASTGLLVIWALFALGRRFWSREAGLLAAAVWVSLPIVCSFGILTDAMFPTMACSLLLVHAHLAYLKEPSRRWLLLGMLAIVLGGLLMWELYFQAALHGVFALIYAATPTGRRCRTDGRPFEKGLVVLAIVAFAPSVLLKWLDRKRPLLTSAPLAWAAGTGLAATGAAAFHFLFAWKKGMVGNIFDSYHTRTSNRELGFLYHAHKHWIDLLYPSVAAWIGIAWLTVFVVRVALRRARMRDQAVLICAILNFIYMYAFSGSSTVHLYRVFYFSAFIALGLTDLIVDLQAGVRWLLRGRASATVGRRVALGAALAVLAAWLYLDVPRAYGNLLESRVMMGTHGQAGYSPDRAKMLFAAEVARRTGPADYVVVHDNLPRRVEFYYYVDRSNTIMSTLAQLPSLLKNHAGRGVVLMDAYPTPSEMRLAYDLMKKHPATRWDRYLMIDLRSDTPGFTEYEFEADKPSTAWRWFVSHQYPPMHAREVTTLYTACVQASVQRAPARVLAEPPVPGLTKIDLVECYHNYEVLRGRKDLTAALLTKLGTTLEKREAPLGTVGRTLGLRAVARNGAELFLIVDKPPPADAVFRWRLEPLLGPKIVGEARPVPSAWPYAPSELRAGYLYAERLAWNAPPGKYLLTVEVGKPTPPPPPPPRRPPLALPPIPVTPRPLATVELGAIEIR